MSLAAISQTALSGIFASETMLAVAADNLANAETTGFKQGDVQLSSATPVGPPGAQVGTGVQVAAIARDTSQGTLLPANGSWNLAIAGDGYFVLEGSDGQQVYTRDGTFHANADGQLVAAGGQRVLGLQGDASAFQGDLQPLFVVHVPSPAQATGAEHTTAGPPQLVGSNGLIQRQLADGSSHTVGQIRLAQFNNPHGLISLGNNQYRATAGSGSAQVGSPGTHGLGRLRADRYEASTTDVAQNLIGLSRAKLLFRANLKVLDVADSLSEELMNMLRR